MEKKRKEKQIIIPVRNNKIKQSSSSDDLNDHIITFNRKKSTLKDLIEC